MSPARSAAKMMCMEGSWSAAANWRSGNLLDAVGKTTTTRSGEAFLKHQWKVRLLILVRVNTDPTATMHMTENPPVNNPGGGIAVAARPDRCRADVPPTAAPYDDDIVRLFFGATVLWGLVGMLVGVIIALQLAWWPANLNSPYTTFGRLRPLHTNAVIFAFTGNIIFTGIYYSMQRLLKTRMFSDVLSRIHFWGWQAVIVGAAVTLPPGLTQSKEYAELIWPLDLLITAVWVIFAVNFFGTIAR